MLKCPSCVRAGPDVGTCGSHLMCPGTNVPVDPATDIVLHCAPCDKTRVVSVIDMVRGRKVALELQCPRGDDCKCRVVELISHTMTSSLGKALAEGLEDVLVGDVTMQHIKEPVAKAGPRGKKQTQD